METVVDSFLRLLDSFRKAPLSFLILVVLTGTLYFAYNQVEYIKQFLPNPEKENLQFQLTLKRDEIINASLEDALELYNADGIVIVQFHNGQYDLTRLPFTKATATYYVGNAAKPNEVFDTRPISTMNRIMLDMWKNKDQPVCVSSKVSDLKDQSYRIRMEGTGMKFLTLCPLTNIRNYPIGYLSVGYRFVPEKNEIDRLLNYQRLLSSRASGYLQDGVVKEND